MQRVKKKEKFYERKSELQNYHIKRRNKDRIKMLTLKT